MAVADLLYAGGFAILSRNLRLGPLELDVVARRRELLVVVEVRARRRGALVSALASVTSSKRGRVLRAARRLWSEQSDRFDGVERVRVDVAAVTFDGAVTAVEYVRGAIH